MVKTRIKIEHNCWANKKKKKKMKTKKTEAKTSFETKLQRTIAQAEELTETGSQKKSHESQKAKR